MYFPNEILVHIFSYLDPSSNIKQVCWQWKGVGDNVFIPSRNAMTAAFKRKSAESIKFLLKYDIAYKTRRVKYIIHDLDLIKLIIKRVNPNHLFKIALHKKAKIEILLYFLKFYDGSYYYFENLDLAIFYALKDNSYFPVVTTLLSFRKYASCTYHLIDTIKENNYKLFLLIIRESLPDTKVFSSSGKHTFCLRRVFEVSVTGISCFLKYMLNHFEIDKKLLNWCLRKTIMRHDIRNFEVILSYIDPSSYHLIEAIRCNEKRMVKTLLTRIDPNEYPFRFALQKNNLGIISLFKLNFTFVEIMIEKWGYWRTLLNLFRLTLID